MARGRESASVSVMSYSRHRRDGNQGEVVDALEKLGYHVIDLSQSDCGFDLLVAKHGVLRAVEVKHPKRLTLTKNEREAHEALKAKGVLVEIVTGLDDSLEVLREPKRNFYGKEAVETPAHLSEACIQTSDNLECSLCDGDGFSPDSGNCPRCGGGGRER